MALDHFNKVTERFPEGFWIKTSGVGYQIKALGRSKGEDAIIYALRGGSTKRIPRSQVNRAFELLCQTGRFTRDDFDEFPGANANPCSFTVLGAFLTSISNARKIEPGVFALK